MKKWNRAEGWASLTSILVLLMILCGGTVYSAPLPAGNIFQLPNNNYCLISGFELQCYEKIGFVSCIDSWSQRSSSEIQKSIVKLPTIPNEYQRIKMNGRRVCTEKAKGVFHAGEKVSSINSFSQQLPDGQKVNISSGDELLILGAEFVGPSFQRKYLAIYQGNQILINGGTQNDHHQFFKTSGETDLPASVGSQLKTKTAMTLRDEPRGAFVAKLAKGTVVKVLDATFNHKLKLWYTVEVVSGSSKKIGVLPAGKFGKYSNWFVDATPSSSVKKYPATKIWGQLIDSVKYIYPWTETRVSGDQLTVPFGLGERFQVVRLSKYGWYLVSSFDGKHKGWIPKQFVEIVRD